MAETTLRFAIMCNDRSLQLWQVNAIRYLLEMPEVDISLVIMPEEPPFKKRTRLRWFNPFKENWFGLLNNHFFKIPERERMPLADLLPDIPVMYCKTRKEGFSEYFSDEDCEKLRSMKLDFILRFGFGIIRGKILEVARYGVWSFHHGDEMRFRGGPPGFWEIYYNKPVTGAVLQRLTEKLDGGIILYKGFFKTIDHSYAGNFGQLLRHSAYWPCWVCKKILLNPGWIESLQPSQTRAKIYRLPDNWQTLRFLGKLALNKVKFHLERFLFKEKWAVGIMKGNPISFLEDIDLPLMDIIEHPDRSGYYADPFGYESQDALKVFVEDFSYRKKKGRITVLNYPDRTTKTVLEKTWHLSYPCLISVENKLYCVPESFENRNVVLYELDRKTLKPIQQWVLIDDISLVDPTLYFHAGKWWLFASPKEPPNGALCIYFADRITGPYKSHPLNPVKMDVRNSRPAGMPFEVNGMLFRPAQDCSRTYGGSVVINEVTRLTETDYAESFIKEYLPPADSAYPHGLHTVNFTENYILLDMKKRIFMPGIFR